MNILLVDDNKYVLKGLKVGIDYSTLGINEIYEAKSMQSAIEILQKTDIDLVLTDIEMPCGTGLQLLEWINEHMPSIVTMFCTNYADFDYARKAVELHSFDYYLKPIQYEKLQELLKRAVDEVKKRKRNRKKEQYAEYWMNMIPKWEVMFLNGEIEKIMEEIGICLQQRIRGVKNPKGIFEEFQVELIQMLSKAFWKRKIDAGKHVNSIWEENMKRGEIHSYDRMMEYTEKLLASAKDFLEETENESVAVVVKKYIDSHYSEEINCESLSKMVYLSASHLEKIFKEKTGKSLGNYLIDVRVEQAQKLLLSGKMTVAQVADSVGYSNFNYFSRLFKNKTGVTPKEYQKQNGR